MGLGIFGTCYFVYYRGILVVVKEFKLRRLRFDKEVKGDVLNEVRMISYLGDYRGFFLFFGVITKLALFCIVI